MNNSLDIESFIKGDRVAFQMLYEAYVDRVFRYINSYTHDKDISKDVTQNVFIQLWKSRLNIDVNKNINAYIYTISRNLLFGELKKRSVFRNYAQKVRDESEEGEEPDFDENLSYEMITEKILRLLLELPESRRKIFLMRWKKGLSNKEIASELSISEKTVSTQIHRTVVYLKRKIGTALVFFF